MKTAERRRTGAAEPPDARRDPQRRLLLVVGLLIAGFLVFFPTRQLIEQHGRMQRLEQRLAELSAQNAELEREVHGLEDREQLELLARERLGLIRPGERAYVFVPQATPVPAERVVDSPWWSRIWRAVTDFVRGRGGG